MANAGNAIKANEELRRKLQQGSQQTQGEVLELQIEELIRSSFPGDGTAERRWSKREKQTNG